VFDLFGDALRRAVASRSTESYRPADNLDNRFLLEEIIIDDATPAASGGHPYHATRPMTALVVSVKAGSVDIYLGLRIQGTGGTFPRIPQFHFGQTNRPETVELRPGIHDFTAVSAGPGATQACILVEGF